MDVTRSEPQMVHYHANIIYLLPLLGIRKGVSGTLVFDEHSVYSVEQHTFAFCTKCVMPVGLRAAFAYDRWGLITNEVK